MSNKTSDKNVATEEDVKVLKDLMEELKLEKQTDLHNNEYGEYITECDVLDLYDKQILALQHILAEREQDKKRIKELEADLYSANEIISDLIDNIPKQVVIDLIENETIDISGFECIAVEDLQELLEGEEVKNVK